MSGWRTHWRPEGTRNSGHFCGLGTPGRPRRRRRCRSGRTGVNGGKRQKERLPEDMKWREKKWWEEEKRRELLTTPGGDVSRRILLLRGLGAHHATHPTGGSLEASISVLPKRAWLRQRLSGFLEAEEGGAAPTAPPPRETAEIAWRGARGGGQALEPPKSCLLYTSPSPRDLSTSRMPSSA